MTIHYVNNSCYEVPASASFFEADSPAEFKEDIPVIDSFAFISKMPSLPPGSGMTLAKSFENKNVIIADFANDAIMSETLDRISDYVEIDQKKKINKYEKLESCKKDENKCGSDGHDLKFLDICDFFNVCRKLATPLTTGEQQLLSDLINAGLLRQAPDGNYEPVGSEKALIGISRSKSVDKRRDIFVHEYDHGLYFVDASFHSKIAVAWATLPPEEQRFLRGAMAATGYYNPNDTSLIETEASGYALGDPLGYGGFIQILYHADKHCPATPESADDATCKDYLSYNGNLKGLFLSVHERYLAIARGNIPFADCPRERSDRRPQKLLNRIQRDFDKLHQQRRQK